jgi:hypothetical protein
VHGNITCKASKRFRFDPLTGCRFIAKSKLSSVVLCKLQISNMSHFPSLASFWRPFLFYRIMIS